MKKVIILTCLLMTSYLIFYDSVPAVSISKEIEENAYRFKKPIIIKILNQYPFSKNIEIKCYGLYSEFKNNTWFLIESNFDYQNRQVRMEFKCKKNKCKEKKPFLGSIDKNI